MSTLQVRFHMPHFIPIGKGGEYRFPKHSTMGEFEFSGPSRMTGCTDPGKI